MRRQRTNAQRRAAQRLAHLGRSIQTRASGDKVRRTAPFPPPPFPRRNPRQGQGELPPRDVSAPLPPRWAAQFEGFGPSATGWDAHLGDFDPLSPDFELPAFQAAPVGPERLNER